MAEKYEKLMLKHKELHDKHIKKCRESYALKTKLQKEQERANYLKNKSKKDYRNSSLSSSMSPNHETIHNSREKTGKKPGEQPGHEHHGRKGHKASKIIVIPPLDEYQDVSRYVAAGRVIKNEKGECAGCDRCGGVCHIGVQGQKDRTASICRVSGRTKGRCHI